MITKIKNKLISIVTKFFLERDLRKRMRSINYNSIEPIFFVLQTPVHTNIGDHAIANAEFEFLADSFKNHTIEVNQALIGYFIKNFKFKLRAKDIIFLHGGGNMGNEYMLEEELRRMVVKSFNNNQIVIFPQTVFYSTDSEGIRQMEKTIEIFSYHQKLSITAREQVSYDFLKKHFTKNNILLTPDIVLYPKHKYSSNKRNYGLEVLRNDQESVLSSFEKGYLGKILEKNFTSVMVSDMHVVDKKRIYSSEERNKVLDFKLNQFAGAKIVITDRLHGMVLCVVTGTPCIVFSNYNQKVLGTFNWIKDLEYIKFVEDIEEVDKALEDLKSLDNKYQLYDPSMLRIKFQPLIDTIYGK